MTDCLRCHAPAVGRSNAAAYCERCRREVRREQKRVCERRRRARRRCRGCRGRLTRYTRGGYCARCLEAAARRVISMGWRPEGDA